MEDTTKTKKKSTNKSKNKNNYDPKWKAKKEGTTKKVVKKTKKSVPKKDSSVNKVDKKVTNKKIEKDESVKDTDLQKTDVFKLPTQDELDKIYNSLKKEESVIPDDIEKSSPKLVIKKSHYNFFSRIFTIIILILLFIVLCIMFFFKAVDYHLGGSVSYSEYASNNYKVCNDDVTVYDGKSCLDRDLEYDAEKVNTINTTFNYEILYNRNYNFNTSYYVVSKLKIYDKYDSSKIRYTTDNTLVSSTKINKYDRNINFSVDAVVDFKNYKKIVENYKNENDNYANALVEVALYLQDGDVSRKVSYITIPLTEETFVITSSNLSNSNQVVVSNKKDMTIDPFYMFVAIICLFMDILLFTYLINFIYLVKNIDNKYNTNLKKILKDYDSIIVNATSSYVISSNSKVIEVESFEELLDARNSLEKPIVFEKVNDIKCRFYLEDGNTVYVFKMKDDGE